MEEEEEEELSNVQSALELNCYLEFSSQPIIDFFFPSFFSPPHLSI